MGNEAILYYIVFKKERLCEPRANSGNLRWKDIMQRAGSVQATFVSFGLTGGEHEVFGANDHTYVQTLRLLRYT